MDTDFQTTQQRYTEYMDRTAADIRSSVNEISEQQRHAFRQTVTAAKRVLITGTGSSMPAALFCQFELQKEGVPASFLPLGSLLGLGKLQAGDVIILCSQGMNRADASLVVRHAQKYMAPLIVFTSNKQTTLTENAVLTCYFEPANEKLFCRPDGVVANIASVATLLDKEYNGEELSKAWQQGTMIPLAIKKDVRYITLASGGLLPANWNLSLALREGCGALAQNFDIETYAHGNYVGDIAHRPFEYIILDMDDTREESRSVRRFMPFIKNSQISYTTVKAPYDDSALANSYILGVIAQSVYESNEANKYNMNRPDGKEENRYYHELDSYTL